MVGLAGLMSNRYKLDDVPDLTGKIAVVTGGSRGIGSALAEGLVKKGAEVHILSSTPEHGDEAVQTISSHADSPNIHHHTVDLGSLSSVDELAQKLNSNLPRLDMLYLIAGVGVAPYGKTQDGLANHFAVNHLAHFLLTDRLLPKLKETSEKKQNADELEKFSTRIVSESSELHRSAPGDLKLNEEEINDEMGPTELYGRSKLFDLLFIRELARKHLPSLTSSSPILALSVHPGAVATEQQKGAAEAYGLLGKALETVASYIFMDPSQGAESAFWAGTSGSVASRRDEVQGRYFTEADGKIDTESKQGLDDELAQKLWDVSVKVLKQKGFEVSF
ncbi:NAD(P)-binding protein [Cylindrobasidium torrendii FP15055 ss-10]|uniref:NAD(P)-binding protein n=1 Tax=Cylindrobasidium torrendii FP15055 ss-10 TaxID=1314674 RepID=A0A0D7BLH7_9AGAR|nr:NAD(P)-binding protein [Cylindrobasidium torrendii FP15055 ss-10]